MPIVEVDSNRHALMVDGTRIDLTNNEFAIGSRLVRAKGAVVVYDALLRAMYGARDEPETSVNVMRVTLTRLRAKMRPYNVMFKTRSGLGVRLEC